MGSSSIESSRSLSRSLAPLALTEIPVCRCAQTSIFGGKGILCQRAIEHYSETLRNQPARHRDSAVYTAHHQNARANAVFQNASLGRGTESPYIAVFNCMI